MKSNGEWDETNDARIAYELIPKPDPKDDGKAYAAGIDCDPNNGRCPYDDLRCVGRRIIKVDNES
jgi:hypothetical protein